MTKQSYKQYINNTHWQELKVEYLTIFDDCEVCGVASNLDIHHLTYERVAGEAFDDLVLLCRWCHYIMHFYHKKMVDKFHVGKLPVNPTLKECTEKLLTNRKLMDIVSARWFAQQEDQNAGWVKLNNFSG